VDDALLSLLQLLNAHEKEWELIMDLPSDNVA
jgi:hypothetical protein